jgi:hypothetical protein
MVPPDGGPIRGSLGSAATGATIEAETGRSGWLHAEMPDIEMHRLLIEDVTRHCCGSLLPVECL